ncbi:hypothetical protein, partial [Clostridium sp. C8-1-8]|uniref:hypothetical protein n=1 Tax=Clostridium sp. C8-1-8 TaxID=2698831 RepID=UPI001A9AB12E
SSHTFRKGRCAKKLTEERRFSDFLKFQGKCYNLGLKLSMLKIENSLLSYTVKKKELVACQNFFTYVQ